jgi:2'-5' RNA ligase
MPFAITLRLDPGTAFMVEEMWRTLSAKSIDADRRQVGCAPHITLAIYADDVPGDLLQAAVEKSARHWKALPISLSGFGIFPAPAAILYAALIVTPAPLARQAEIQAALPELQVHPHYRPDAWVPLSP